MSTKFPQWYQDELNEPQKEKQSVSDFKNEVIDRLRRFYDYGDTHGYSNTELSRIKSCIQKVEEIQTSEVFEAEAINEPIQTAVQIELVRWEHTCAEGCCYDYGVDLIVNQEKLTQYAEQNLQATLQLLLDKLGIKAEVTESLTITTAF